MAIGKVIRCALPSTSRMPNSLSVSRKHRIVPPAIPGHASGKITLNATIQPFAPRLFGGFDQTHVERRERGASVGRTTNGA